MSLDIGERNGLVSPFVAVSCSRWMCSFGRTTSSSVELQILRRCRERSCGRASFYMLPNDMMDVEEWLERADRDLRVATLALNADPMLGEAIAFHTQQAAEKALKGFLTAYRIAFPKTHELEGLVVKCATIDPQFRQYMVAASILTPYATEFRYPGGRIEPSDAEARAAYQHATDIVRFVRDALSSATSP
jgi:HEPN domain-containing protein